jgi:hypothetical protein
MLHAVPCHIPLKHMPSASRTTNYIFQHDGFLCVFVRFSLKSSINMQHCIYFEAQITPLNTIHISFRIHLRPVFDPSSIRVRAVVDKVTIGQIFLLVLRFSRVTIIPLMLHIHLHVTLTKTAGRSLGTFQKATLFHKMGSTGEKTTFTFYMLPNGGLGSIRDQ